jgi:transitional endoplasmic reticulum ATPase
MNILENIIQITPPSVSFSELKKYDATRAKMNSENIEQKNERPKIGFI